MKTRLLKIAYETEDGYVFEAVEYDDFPKAYKIISTSSSYTEAIERLEEKKIPYNIYKKRLFKF